MDYGYQGTAVFPFNLRASDSAARLSVAQVKGHVRWQVCREVCVPERAWLGLILPSSATAQSRLIASAVEREPVPLPAGDSVRVSGTRDHLKVTLHTGRSETVAEFFPFDEFALRNAANQEVTPVAAGVQLSLERGDISDTLPPRLKGVVELSGGRSWLIDAAVSASAAPLVQEDSRASGVAIAILLAFGGGIILNLMPCVFPVLFLKALAWAGSAQKSQRTQRLHGLSYTAGILLSFWLLAALLLILRAGGREAGWGFQLQSPAFVVAMVSLLFFMALSLLGQFDLGLSLTGKGDTLTRREGHWGSLFTGALAALVATPCTAPLMGAAIGFALSRSAAVAFSIFTSLALGLATPYLILTWQPSWAKKLPRPGRWMELLKQLTAVPLLATVIWLIWVYGRLHSATPEQSADSMARLLFGLLFIAAAGWILGRWPAKRLGTICAVGLIAASQLLSLTGSAADRLRWQPFSQAALEDAHAHGLPVFVDFTAAWCLSCQVNERAVLDDRSVVGKLRAGHYLLLRADWTRYDPAITRELSSVECSGVPTYIIYPAGSEAAPRVLPEFLSRDVVLRAISTR
jgi:thiol:disulfide interchange protein DsbD